MTDRDELRRVAEAATPGPWEAGTGSWVETVSGDGEDWSYVRPAGSANSEITNQMLHGVVGADAQTVRDHEYIATFDPPTVLALLDDLEAAETEIGLLDARAFLAEERHRDLVSRLGFGDNITEPMADNDTIVAWVEALGRDADEWGESQAWRIDCALAGHPDDEDCYEHDPARRLERAEAALARLVEGVRGLVTQWATERYPDAGDPGWNQGYDTRREADGDALTTLLAEVEGAADE